MTEEKALEIVNRIVNEVFSTKNLSSLDQIKEKFAFDLYLPLEVEDSITKEVTYTDSRTATKFMTTENMELKDKTTGWMQEKIPLHSLEEMLTAWRKIDYQTTERVQDSINVSKSDTIYGCENVYHSTNCNNSKNIVFSDSCSNSEYLLASQRSAHCQFSIRVDDSINCSNCYNVIFSNKVSNSFFIQDCFNIRDCLFCSHLAGKKYCIANMQYTKEEYLFYKEQLIKWILED